MHLAIRIVIALLGVVLFVGGVLFGVLGVWGVSRGGSRAWLLAVIGAVGFVAGASLVALALRGRDVR